MIDNRLSLFIKDIISDKIIYTPGHINSKHHNWKTETLTGQSTLSGYEMVKYVFVD